jgi:hypothetical protein
VLAKVLELIFMKIFLEAGLWIIANRK